MTEREQALWTEGKKIAEVLSDHIEQETGVRPTVALMHVPYRWWLTTVDFLPEGWNGSLKRDPSWDHQAVVSARSAREAARITLSYHRTDVYPDMEDMMEFERVAVAPMRELTGPGVVDYITGDRKYQSHGFEDMWLFEETEVFKTEDLNKPDPLI